MRKRAIDFVIFDIDGTLVDSQNMIVQCLQLTCAQLGIACPESRRQLLSGVGLPLPQAVKVALPHVTDDKIPQFIACFREHYVALMPDVLNLQPLFDGALPALQRLQAAGYRLGICTSKAQAGLDAVLDAHNIRHLFASIKTPDQGPGKPDPFLLNQAMAEMNVAPQKTVFVGDSTYDIAAGIAAHSKTLGVTWGYHTAAELKKAGANKIVDAMDQLVPAIETW